MQILEHKQKDLVLIFSKWCVYVSLKLNVYSLYMSVIDSRCTNKTGLGV